MNLLYKRILLARPTFVVSQSTTLFVSLLKSFYTKTITPQIQEKANGEIKLPRKTSRHVIVHPQ